MFSYRHSFHAGNHGDVLKHLCQLIILSKLKEKDKPFTYFDTHSGAGVYHLDSTESLKTREFQSGIAKLTDVSTNNELLAQYLKMVMGYSKFNQYPGSPEIAHNLLRAQDDIVLMEWHNNEYENLKSNINGRNISIHHRDGFEGLLAMTPPKMKRGMVLIDPPYELATEYKQVVETVVKAYKKWSTGIYAIWYPLIKDRKENAEQFTSASSKQGQSQAMLQALSRQDFKNLLQVELRVTSEEQAEGMYGSGLLIINAPWQLDTQLASALKEMAPQLASDAKGSFAINWLIEEK
ncbi:23S rRNA (adenine(2030)-N(6))-methyltransferase RlmJ [Paraglaciecola aquimarina]|uniref:Ribosomal RNA large subunit methyltransferase J n=1 Tax=Paraglaciecola aquimarina TaxID=1235557 RepID=A0ABU3SYT6_9ALTE|nr:23S rRNA (adenine(2030)-N(6))-methyltransferase RlmJ [Paraglaciecola aquimarina]MDU0355179.1 23S rRNA (adenine(2030)-N(6))-methyltransferase RlmJ [Paraglaciecola aquimarina]